MTIEEVEMYPSIQAKIWGNIGQIGDLLDMVLDSFIKRSVTGGLGSIQVKEEDNYVQFRPSKSYCW